MPKDSQHKAPKRTRHYPPRTDLTHSRYMPDNMEEAAYEKLCDATEEISLLLAPLGFSAECDSFLQGFDSGHFSVYAWVPSATPGINRVGIVVEVRPTERVDRVTYVTRYPNRLAHKAKSAPYYYFATNSAVDMLRHLIAMFERNKDILL